jgi:hypothetical protein
MSLGGIEPDAYTHLQVFFRVRQPIGIYGQILVKWSNFQPNTTLFTDAIADILLVQHGLKQAFTTENREIQKHKTKTITCSWQKQCISFSKRNWWRRSGHETKSSRATRRNTSSRLRSCWSMYCVRQRWHIRFISSAHDENKATKG